MLTLITVVILLVIVALTATVITVTLRMQKCECLPCQNDCCANPKKVDPVAGCQTDPQKDEDPPMRICGGK